jgi:DNA-3-methyladenine glycosylase
LTHSAPNAEDPSTEQPQRWPQRLTRLAQADVSADAVTTARHLLGTLLVRDDAGGRRVVRIVETEAYAGPRDRASHARAGRTPRTAVMFGRAGLAYVYLVYGMHHCLNVVCGPEGEAAAVLIRATEPVAGLARMRQRRGRTAGEDARLAAGPARTCQALDIDRRLSGVDLLADERLWLALDDASQVSDAEVVRGTRIGVDYAGPEWAGRPWRYGLAGSPALSRPFPVQA